MTRVARPVFRKFKGEGADKYEPIARTILGQLEKRLKNTGQRYGVWRRTLLDGTKIFVAYVQRPGNIPPLRTIRILAPEGGVLEITEWYLESGLLSLEAWREANCLTYRPAQRYYPNLLSTLADSWVRTGQTEPEAPLGKAYLEGTFLYGEHQEEGQSYAVGCPDPQDTLVEAIAEEPLYVSEFDILFLSESDELDAAGCGESQYCAGDIQIRKYAQAKVPASLWSGKLRHFIQALYGAKKRNYEAIQDTPLAIPPLVLYGDTVLSWDGSAGQATHGLVTTEDGYFLCSLAQGLATFRKLHLGSAKPLWEALVQRYGSPVAPSDEDRLAMAVYEGYLFANADGFGAPFSVSFDWPETIEGVPVYHGWQFTRDGTAASIVLTDRPLGGDDYNFRLHRVTLGIEYRPNDQTFLISITETDGPHNMRARNGAQMVWHPSLYPTGMDHYAFYSCEGLHDDGSLQWTNAPLYCWYDTEDRLIELVSSYEYVPAPGVRGSSTILTGCDLALSGNKKTTQFTATVDSRYDSLSIRRDGEIVASVVSGNGSGSVIARACVYNCTWDNEWHFHGWTPGTPETDMLNEVLGSQYCDWCDLSEIQPNDPYAWLECMGMEPYPLHNYIGYYTTTECTGTFYPNDLWNIGYVKLNSFGHSNGNSFSAVGLGFFGECNAIIPWFDCSAAFLMSEITSQSAGLITLSRLSARGSTLWDYCPGGAEYISCGGNDHVVSAYGVGPFPRYGYYDGGWLPGITWVPETGLIEYHTGSEDFIDRRIIFVGRDGVGRTLLNIKARGSAAFQAKLEGYPLLGGLSLMEFVGVGSGILDREVIPENDDWQDDNLWPWFADYTGPVYGVCTGAGSTVFGIGPQAWQSAVFNVIIAARGGEWVADENGADGVLPSLNDDPPYPFSWVGWA